MEFTYSRCAFRFWAHFFFFCSLTSFITTPCLPASNRKVLKSSANRTVSHMLSDISVSIGGQLGALYGLRNVNSDFAGIHYCPHNNHVEYGLWARNDWPQQLRRSRRRPVDRSNLLFGKGGYMATPEEQITPADAAIVTTGTGRKGRRSMIFPKA